MSRRILGLAVIYLCAVSTLDAQTVQFSTRQDIQTNATHLTGLALADFRSLRLPPSNSISCLHSGTEGYISSSQGILVTHAGPIEKSARQLGGQL